MPPRIPTQADFAPLLPSLLPHTLHFPSPPESTTAILILLHGLGDSDANFSSFAANINLPGVLAITVRGVTPLPGALLPPLDDDDDAEDKGPRHFHWGDDLKVDEQTGELDEDPGFEKAEKLIMEKLVGDVLVGELGWETSDILLFGFGNGGALALGLASNLRKGPAVEDVSDDKPQEKKKEQSFKGVVSLGGPLPASMVPSVSSRSKAQTPVLVLQLDEEEAERVKGEFSDVSAVNWARKGVDTPRGREEMLPIMKFLADRLNTEFQAEP